MKRKLINCAKCLEYIYTYPKLNMGDGDIWCTDCQVKDDPNIYTPDEIVSRKMIEIGPYHKRIDRYRKINIGKGS